MDAGGKAGGPRTGRGAGSPAPIGRGAEKALMMAAAAINVVMASITLFMYSPWFKDKGYDILSKAGKISDMAAVNNVATVAQTYGLMVLVMGVVTFVVAVRALRPSSIVRGVEIWLFCCMVFSLATADWLSLIAYSLAFVAYLARNKAIRLSQAGGSQG